MNGVPDAVSERMRIVLEGVCDQVELGSSTLVKRHVWYNTVYVGTTGERAAAWYGWSANLRKVNQQYKTIYIDYITLPKPFDKLKDLFGSVFTNAIGSAETVVFLYVTSCPYVSKDKIRQAGYIFRQVNNIIHPGIILTTNELFNTPLTTLYTLGFELIKLQFMVCSDASK